MSAASNLLKLYKYLIGGATPPSAASSTGDVSAMVKYLIANPQAFFAPEVVGPGSDCSIGTVLAAGAAAAPVSTSGMAVNNNALYIPFVLLQAKTARKMSIRNGATITSNVDVGIYNSAFTRLVSIGGVAQAGASAQQVFDIADTVLQPGLYYIGISMSSTTGLLTTWVNPGSSVLVNAGCFQESGAYPLPATATPASVNNTVNNVPVVIIHFTTVT